MANKRRIKIIAKGVEEEVRERVAAMREMPMREFIIMGTAMQIICKEIIDAGKKQKRK
jgi:hypothetical protein